MVTCVTRAEGLKLRPHGASISVLTYSVQILEKCMNANIENMKFLKFSAVDCLKGFSFVHVCVYPCALQTISSCHCIIFAHLSFYHVILQHDI